MINDLIKEMLIDCHVCFHGYIYPDDDEEGQGSKKGEAKECPSCNGTGKALSYEGERLRHLILKGVLP